MKYFATGLLVLLLSFISCQKIGAQGTNLTSADLEKLIATGKNYTLIDVRTAEEFASGHIPTAINIPFDVIGEQIPVKEKSAYIILYCRSGNRSGQAYNTLKKLGYTNLVNFGAVSSFKGKLE